MKEQRPPEAGAHFRRAASQGQEAVEMVEIRRLCWRRFMGRGGKFARCGDRGHPSNRRGPGDAMQGRKGRRLIEHHVGRIHDWAMFAGCCRRRGGMIRIFAAAGRLMCGRRRGRHGRAGAQGSGPDHQDQPDRRQSVHPMKHRLCSFQRILYFHGRQFLQPRFRP